MVIGRVVGPRGVKGELKVALRVALGDWLLGLRQVWLGGDSLVRQVTRARFFQGRLLLCLQGIEDRNQAETWRGAAVRVQPDARPVLPAGKYYPDELVGLEVRTESHERLGRITQVLATGANDVYVVLGERGEVLLPAIPEVILRVDLRAGVMTVHVLEGLR